MIKRTSNAGDDTIRRFSDGVAKGKSPHYAAAGGIRGQAGGPAGAAKRDLTNRKFSSGDAGAEATEKRSAAKYNVGGKGKDNTGFGPQQSGPKRPGSTGKTDAKGPGANRALGGPKLGSIGRGAVTALPGQSGTPASSGADKSLRGR
jgi:hypothetical protein